MLRQLKAIEQTCGFLKAVRLRPEWIAEVRNQTNVREALASLQIEGSSLTLEAAFELSRERPARELRDSEREFYNYLRAFETVDGLCDQRDAVVTKGDLRGVHRLLTEDVRGGRRAAGEFRREDVKVGDVEGDAVVVQPRPAHLAPGGAGTRGPPHLGRGRQGKGRRTGRSLDSPGGPRRRRPAPARLDPPLRGRQRAHRADADDAAPPPTRLRLPLPVRAVELLQTKNRDDYYAALRTADASGDYTAWLTYFLGGFAYQMVRIQELARGARGLRRGACVKVSEPQGPAPIVRTHGRFPSGPWPLR